MFKLKEIRTSFLIALWLMLLTFPLMVIRVNTIEDTIVWRWNNLVLVGVGAFVVAHVWRYLLQRTSGGSSGRRAQRTDKESLKPVRRSRRKRVLWWEKGTSPVQTLKRPSVKYPVLTMCGLLVLLYPLVTSLYQTSIMISALIYVILALGLNIVIGLGGLLHLGYAAFYMVGAYTYALLNTYFGVSFWIALPLGAIVAAVLGILLGIPVLRLRGDYLAIVTLGFGEIARIVAENWVGLTNGPRGIPGIDRPQLFGMSMNISQASNYTYYIALGITAFTIFMVYRMENSRLGRAWEAMREDDIASEAMGVDLVRAKLTAFSLGALWAGLAGVLFAAKTTFVSPRSFSLLESITVLLAVVLGGIGSIPGVIVGALIVSLLPEVLREFSQYRMLLFGALLIVMMVFRPGGIIPKRRKVHTFDRAEEQ